VSRQAREVTARKGTLDKDVIPNTAKKKKLKNHQSKKLVFCFPAFSSCCSEDILDAEPNLGDHSSKTGIRVHGIR